jgi:hypothetical protein
LALADVPHAFHPDSEEEVRVAIAYYFRELGFEADEMSFEDRFSIQLGHTSLELGVTPKTTRRSSRRRTRVAGRSDLLLARYGQPLAIVETKAPDHPLTEQDALQALSYARLLLDMAPYAIVTNGRETRVYDTFARTLDVLEVPTNSHWYKNGQQVLSIGDDLRFQAARTLIGISAQTLGLFCQKQVSIALEDLKGSAYERKPYIPEVYLPRQDAVEQLTSWFAADHPCFAVVGDSGIGKTTLLRAAAEHLLAQGYFVLFYSAGSLKSDLETAICNDFVWEFHCERGLAHIIERFEEIARIHRKKLVLFLDAMDRFPGRPGALKAELLDLVSRLRRRSVRLCLSCKSFDWATFVIDDGRSYNRLATAIYPSMQHPQAVLPPDAHAVGTWLHEYTDEELDQIFPKYQHIFSLQGPLQGSARKACHSPLILRLFAEIWSGRNEALPQEISQRELFEAYWEVQLSQVRHKLEAERWLSEVARIGVESGERQVGLTELRRHLPSLDAQDETYQDLIRSGLLVVNTDMYGLSTLSFGLDTLRSYVYALKVQEWPQKVQRGRSQEVATSLCQLLDHPVGVEVVEFYVRAIDHGETRLLADVALHDIYKFAQLIEILPGRSFVFSSPPGDAQQQAFLTHLTNFAIAYSDLSRTYFPALCERIEPYMKGEVGLWISGSMSSTMYQFRGRTSARPEPLLVLSPEVAQALWHKQASPQIYNEVRPGGSIHLDMRELALVEHLPQKMAWERILSQIAQLFVKRCLDETTSPYILQERIWQLLTEEPAGFWGGVPITGQYWQVFGLQTPEEVQEVPIEELITRTQVLIAQYMDQYSDLIQQHGLNAFTQGEPSWSRWYVICIRKLRRLDYFLRALQDKQSRIACPFWRLGTLFDYLRTGDLAPTIQIVQQLLPSILQSYRTLVQQNVAEFADKFPLFHHANASLLVEVAREPSHPTFHSDFLKLVYAVLPTSNLPDKFLVYTCEERDSLMRIRLRQKTLQGYWTETSGVQGATFGQGKIEQRIGGRYIDEPNAFFYFTQFPSHYPVLDQVYQLLGNELYNLLRGDYRDWHDIEAGKINDEMLDWWISGRP